MHAAADPPRRELSIAPVPASPEEAAAVTAAISRFLADHAPAPEQAPTISRWQRAALIEGVERAPEADVWGGSGRT